MRANEVAHVFHPGHAIYPHLPEHFDRLSRAWKRNVGGRPNHDCPGERHSLNERERNHSRPRRQVNHEIIKLTPLYRAQKLLDDGMQHRPPPDQRLITWVEKTDGNDLQPMNLERHNPVISQDLRLSAGSQHEWYVWAVDVSIEQANFMAELRQCDGEVNCKRSFAHAALSGAYRDNCFHSGQRLRRRRLLAETWGIRRTQASTFPKPGLRQLYAGV